MNNKEIFLKAIHEKKKVEVFFNSQDKGKIRRICIPFDYGPSRRYSDMSDRYHFYDLNSPDGKHNLSPLPGQIINIDILDESFDPANYVKWTPNWFIERDWGKYS
jgi:hypothetical protein